MTTTLRTLPAHCYGLLAGAVGVASLILIKRDETGYYPTEGYGPRSEELVDLLNARQDVTPAERAALEFGSAFGWDLPGADPAAHADHVRPRQAAGEERGAYLERVKRVTLAAYEGRTTAAKLGTVRLTKVQALALPLGTLVHVLHEEWGTDQHDAEVIHPLGSIARVQAFGTYPKPQGLYANLVFPTGHWGTWDEGDEDPFDFALVTDPALRAEAEAAFAAFYASDEPTPPYPTPLLDAALGGGVRSSEGET